jgi:arylsulfatase A-like enzyme
MGTNEPADAAAQIHRTGKGSLVAWSVPGTVLLIALWIGLVSGFLDVGLLIVKQHLAGDRFFRLGDHFFWLIPAAVTVLLTVFGLCLAFVGLMWRGAGFVRVAIGMLTFIGFLDASARVPLAPWSQILLSAGVAVEAARWAGGAGHRIHSFGWLARRTTPLLAGGLLSLILIWFGERVWSERKVKAFLPTAPTAGRNVLLIVWDTVRTNNLSLYGYKRLTSPNLDRLARQGVRFDRAFATAPWTLTSHSSMFTGRWPHELSANWFEPLDDTYPILAEFLTSKGYDTAGFVANLDYCGRETGLARGFAHYEDYPLTPWDIFTRYVALGNRIDWITEGIVLDRLLKICFGERFDVIPHAREHAKNAEMIDRSFLKWLDSRQGRGRPFFAFLNYNDAHTPYEVPDRSLPGFGLRPDSYVDRAILQSWEQIDKTTLPHQYIQMAIDVYDDSIFYLDKQLGILLDELTKRGMLDDTLVIVASDHGEHLGDHGLFFHGCSLYRQLVNVPLVIVDPGRGPTGRVIREPASSIDLPATIASLLGHDKNSPFPGKSLERFWTETNVVGESDVRPLLMETDKPPYPINQGREPVSKGPMKSLISEGLHYIRRGDGVEEMYDLDTDPLERTDVVLYPRHFDALERIRAWLEAITRKP